MAGPNGTPLIDRFNRADEIPITTPWTNRENSLALASNLLASNTGGGNSALYTASTYGPDCEAYITIATKATGDGDSVGCLARAANAGSPPDGYYVFAINKTGTDQIALYKYSGGYTQIGSTYTGEFNGGDIVGISCVGTTIKAWLYQGGTWTADVTATDSTFTGAGYLGVYCQGTVARLDDFGGGAVTDAAVHQAMTMGMRRPIVYS